MGLFVTLGTFTKDATVTERQHHDLTLVDGLALVRLILEAYDGLPMQWKQILPMKRTWVVDAQVVSG